MVVVFFGTPEFALPALDRLRRKHELKAVVTQPDKPRGRHLNVRPSAAKEWALKYYIPVHEPESLKDADFKKSLNKINPEVMVVAAYGKLIPKELLQLAKFGCLNIHASLLPRYRGAAPIQRAIMDGATRTGVTIMQMDEGMDTGNILKQGEVTIRPEDDTESLSAKLAEVGAELIIETLYELAKEGLKPIKQDDNLATYAPPIAKEESEIDWSSPAGRIANHVRALKPAPGTHTHWHNKRLKILSAAEVAQEAPGPGVMMIDHETLIIGARQGALQLLEVQPEGKKAMSAAEFVRGYRPQSGELLGAEPHRP